MTNRIIKITILFSFLLMGTTASAGCKAKYMADPCSIDGYAIVETEKSLPEKHHWMHDIHYFSENTTQKNLKR